MEKETQGWTCYYTVGEEEKGCGHFNTWEGNWEYCENCGEKRQENY